MSVTFWLQTISMVAELLGCQNDQHTLASQLLFSIFFSTGFTTHCGFVFCSPLAGYSLLAYEVS
jgi:hypothetical protein